MSKLPRHLQDVCDSESLRLRLFSHEDGYFKDGFQACYEAMFGDMLEFLNKIEDDCTDDYCCSGYTIEKFEKKYGIK